MSEPILQSLIAATSAISVSITALLLNYKLFNSLERRLEILEKDFKEFYKTLLNIDNRVEKLEDKIK